MSRIQHRRLLLLTTALTLALPSLSLALPTGGSVSQGSATISSTLTQTTVDQTTSKAVINWTGFNTSNGQTVQFNDPNSSAITLNRVSGAATSFNGALNSNGNVWVINSNGVLIGSTGKVNTNGFLATTSNITDATFMAGNYNFTPGGGSANATASNAGTITVAGAGLAALVAPNVANTGSITANVGKITLASGDTYAVDLAGDGLINLAASKAMTQQALANTGTLNATGGSVVITAAQASAVLDNVINLDGVIEANNLTVSNQSGDLNYGAAFDGSTGGSVTLSAYRNITVDAGTQISPASGKLNVTLDSNDAGAAGGGAIYMAPGSAIYSNGGNITLGGGTNTTGYAVGDNVSGFNNGIYLAGGVYLFAEGEGNVGGNITINGEGANVSGANVNSTGVDLAYNGSEYRNTLQTSGNGAITINGLNGGSANATSIGVDIEQSVLQSSAGNITVEGTPNGATSAISTGVQLYGSSLTSGSGAIYVIGFPGNGSLESIGVNDIGSNVTTGSGTLLLEGESRNGSNGGQFYGVATNGGVLQTSTGAVDIYGSANPSPGGISDGVLLGGNVDITSSGKGSVGSIYVSGGAGGNGVVVGNASITSADADINIIGSTSGVNGDAGILFNSAYSPQGPYYVDTTGKGNINLTGVGTYGVEFSPGEDTFLQTKGSGNVNVTTNFLGDTPLVETNNFTIAPETASDTVIVGGSTNYGGPGVLALPANLLQEIGGANITVGSTADTGPMTVEKTSGWYSNLTLLNGTGNITLTGVTSAEPGVSITIADTGGDFINQAGAGALAPGAGGRFLVYTQGPSFETLDGLGYNFQQFGCTYGQNCLGLPATGNGLVYSGQIASE